MSCIYTSCYSDLGQSRWCGSKLRTTGVVRFNYCRVFYLLREQYKTTAADVLCRASPLTWAMRVVTSPRLERINLRLEPSPCHAFAVPCRVVIVSLLLLFILLLRFLVLLLVTYYDTILFPFDLSSVIPFVLYLINLV